MKLQYLLDNYENIVREIKDTKYTDQHVLETRTNDAFDHYLIIPVQFYESDGKLIFQSLNTIHSLHPNADNWLDASVRKSHAYQYLLPEIETELAITNQVQDYYWSTNSPVTLYIKIQCESTEVTDDVKFYHYCYNTLKDENEKIRDYIKFRISKCKSTAEIQEYIRKKHHFIDNFTGSIAKRIKPNTIPELYEISKIYNRIDCLKLVYILAEQILYFLEEDYRKFIAPSSKITYKTLIQKQYELAPKIGSIKSVFEKSEVDKSLISIALQPIIKFENLIFDNPFSNSEFRYCTAYIKKVYSVIQNPQRKLTNADVVDWLIYMNLNTLQFFKYISKKLYSDLEQYESVPQKLDFLFFNLKSIKQKPIREDKKLKSKLPSIKYQLAALIEEEIEYLRRKTSLESVNTPVISSDNKNKMLCDLSVAQLSYFSALMVKAGIIKNDNQSEVFRFVANNFKTPSTEQISPVSVKTKYYNVEEPTIQVVREKIIKLLSLTKL